MRLVTLGGVLGPMLFSGVTIYAAASSEDYNHLHQFISELGATGVVTAPLMNYLGFVPSGLMIALFGLGLRTHLPRSRINTLLCALVCAFGFGVSVEGLISCDLGCPQDAGTIENVIHNALAPMILLSLIVAITSFGFRWRRDSSLLKLSTYSLVTGLLALASLGALASTLGSREFTGLWQRILLLLLFSWCMVVGTYITAWGRRAERPSNARMESDI